nr:hypothetical protein [Chthoniobacterales bacterium]
VPCISGKCPRIPANLFGVLVATNEEPRKLVFVARRNGRAFSRAIHLEGLMTHREPKFLSDNLVIFPATGNGPKYLFIFPRSSGPVVEEISEYLRARLIAPESVIAEPEHEPALQS